MYILYPKTKIMKISKTAVFTLWTVFAAASLWLMVVYAAERDLSTDLSKVVQHIEKVIFVSTWDNTKATMDQTNGLVRIRTNNFILTTGNNINWTWSSILWWESNNIKWEYDVILGWEWNIIDWNRSTILWWKSNTIIGDSSVIWWWESNTIKWTSSVILWSTGNIVTWSYSIVVWNNSTVEWNNSAALWVNSHVKAYNSFLWTDWNHWDEKLEADSTFAVVSKSGMVINTNKAHPFAQLTIWWPIILSENVNNNKNIQCGGGIGGWIVKTVNSGWNMCLCSCDGSGWNSIFGLGRCTSICDNSIKPECGDDLYSVCFWFHNQMYSWTCKIWEVVEWTWAYLTDKNNIVHRTCQTDDGNVKSCTWNSLDAIEIGSNICRPEHAVCAWPDFEHAIRVDPGFMPHPNPIQKTLWPSEAEAALHHCAYYCDEENDRYYDPINGKCFSPDNPCILKANDKTDIVWTPGWCNEPFTGGPVTLENGMYSWNCLLNWKVIYGSSCKECADGYYWDDTHTMCKPMTGCHHCAKSGFPYCFTIDYDTTCDEGARWRSENL